MNFAALGRAADEIEPQGTPALVTFERTGRSRDALSEDLLRVGRAANPRTGPKSGRGWV